MNRFQQIDWAKTKMESFNLFTKLIRTKDPNADEQTHEIPAAGGKRRLTKCLTTLDLTSLGVGSCVGTGMYLVTGMVARKVAGPGVVISFIIAAIASIFSGACYAEFGVRVPHTTGSAYMYSYVTVGEFIAFVIGWNMVLEYLIGTSACARALSACFNSLVNGAISNFMVSKVGTIFGRPPDFIACGITLLMMIVMITGVRKSLIFNNVLNVINFTVWVFIMTAGMFYVDTNNWTQHHGFLPFGWSGVFTGAATCFYAFIGFDIIATTGEEAHNPKRSIPLAIVTSLAIILCAYVTSAMMLTLIVPYDRVDEDSALVEMFAHVKAPTCKYIVAVGAVAGLTVSMFGSMFPMPRIVYAMAQDGLIFRQLSAIWEATGTPGLATLVGGLAAALVALLIRLEVLVEMMSIGTLLAYTLVSTCVLILRYQPHSTNLIELLPHSLRTPIVDPAQPAALDDLPVYRETTFGGFPDLGGQTRILSSNQHVMVRRVTRSSPDSDDTFPGDEGDDYGRDDQFLVQDNTENKFYGTVHGTPASAVGGRSSIGPALDSIGRKLQALTYLCPGLLPWVDLGPATDNSGFFVMKAVGVLYILIIIFDLFAAYGSPAASPTTATLMTVLVIAMFIILMMISRKPQNRNPMLYMTPGLPFVPAIAITVNIYLILNLSILTLVRFTVWMIIGLFMYFKYGIINSTLEQEQAKAQEDPQPPPITSVLSHKVIPPRKEITPDQHSRNIFQGDRMFGSDGFKDPLLAWEESSESTPQKSSNQYKHVEQRYNEKTNNTSSHVSTSSSRPTWANTDYSAWND